MNLNGECRNNGNSLSTRSVDISVTFKKRGSAALEA